MSVRQRACVLLATIAVASTVLTVAASADSSSDAQLVSDINSARSQNGLRSYAVASDLSAIARRWAAHMAARRTLEHNPSLTSEACCWSDLAENVGVGGSAAQVHRAFMGSSEHRANILSTTYTQMGIGTARASDGQLYVDEVFRRPTAAAASSPASQAQTAVRSPSIRASRSQPRTARVSVPHAVPRQVPGPEAVLGARIARWRQRVAALAHADAVTAAFAYLRGLASVTR